MVIGVVVNVYAYVMKLGGVDCDVSFYHLNFGLIMYASYFFLFAHFFHTAYLQKEGADRLRLKRSNNNTTNSSKTSNEISTNNNNSTTMIVNLKQCSDVNANFFSETHPTKRTVKVVY